MFNNNRISARAIGPPVGRRTSCYSRAAERHRAHHRCLKLFKRIALAATGPTIRRGELEATLGRLAAERRRQAGGHVCFDDMPYAVAATAATTALRRVTRELPAVAAGGRGALHPG